MVLIKCLAFENDSKFGQSDVGSVTQMERSGNPDQARKIQTTILDQEAPSVPFLNPMVCLKLANLCEKPTRDFQKFELFHASLRL